MRTGDSDGVAEYLWRVRAANPESGGNHEQVLRKYTDLAQAVMAAPLTAIWSWAPTKPTSIFGLR